MSTNREDAAAKLRAVVQYQLLKYRFKKYKKHEHRFEVMIIIFPRAIMTVKQKNRINRHYELNNVEIALNSLY